MSVVDDDYRVAAPSDAESPRRECGLNDPAPGPPGGFDCGPEIDIGGQQNDHVMRASSGGFGDADCEAGIDSLLLIGNERFIAVRALINLFIAIGAPRRVPPLLFVHEHAHLRLATEKSVNPVLVPGRPWIRRIPGCEHGCSDVLERRFDIELRFRLFDEPMGKARPVDTPHAAPSVERRAAMGQREVPIVDKDTSAEPIIPDLPFVPRGRARPPRATISHGPGSISQTRRGGCLGSPLAVSLGRGKRLRD